MTAPESSPGSSKLIACEKVEAKSRISVQLNPINTTTSSTSTSRDIVNLVE